MIRKSRSTELPRTGPPRPEDLEPSPFLRGYGPAAEEGSLRALLPNSLARLAHRAAMILGRDEGPERLEKIYRLPSYKDALRALTADSWIINRGPDGRDRTLALATPPRNTLDDVPRQSMLTHDTFLYRSPLAIDTPRRARLDGRGKWLFMYDGYLVRCENPVARRSEKPYAQQYSIAEARRLGFSTLYDPTGQLPPFVYPEVYQYRVGLPDDVSLQGLIERGDAVPSPLRHDLFMYPDSVRGAYDAATPRERQNPAVRESIERFITDVHGQH